MAHKTVLLQIELPADVLAELDVLAPHFGETRADAIESALKEWVWRWRKKYTRRERLEVERAMRDARDTEPLGPLLDRFRAQMEAASSAKSQVGLRSVRERARFSHMESDDTTTRQVAAQLDLEFYDRIVGIAKGDDRSIAYLIRKGLEKVAAEHDVQESSIAAA